MEQATHVLRRRKEYDDANKALVPDLQEIKERIKEFNQRKGDLIVSEPLPSSDVVGISVDLAGKRPRRSGETNEGSTCERILHYKAGC